MARGTRVSMTVRSRLFLPDLRKPLMDDGSSSRGAQAPSMEARDPSYSQRLRGPSSFRLRGRWALAIKPLGRRGLETASCRANAPCATGSKRPSSAWVLQGSLLVAVVFFGCANNITKQIAAQPLKRLLVCTVLVSFQGAPSSRRRRGRSVFQETREASA